MPRDPEPDDDALSALIASGIADSLAAALTAGSRLPGPRANLALAARFADLVAETGNRSAFWPVLLTWLALSPSAAPTNDPREFLPFCAAQALGALYAPADADRRREIVVLLRTAADDERWRLREGVAMGLQRIGAQDIVALKTIIDDWLPTATFTGQRAIIAALAHPPILKDEATARYALSIAETVMQNVLQMDLALRKSEAFRILRTALEYALSVFVAAHPAEGVPFLHRWQAIDDPVIQRIIRQNLGKARLKRVMGDGVIAHPARGDGVQGVR